MEGTTAAFIIAVIGLVTKYGIPGVVQIIKSWDVEDPTLDEIEALKERVPKPETYFSDQEQ